MIFLALLAATAFDASAIAQTSATLNALGPHPFGSPRNRAAAQFVAASLQDAGLAQTTVEDFEFEGTSGTNVVSSLPGRSDRLLIIATHHDTKKDSADVSSRSRSLSLLIEIGRQASRMRPAKTWILASFDGGEAGGEGLAYYLQSLGKSRAMVDAVIVLDATELRNAGAVPTLIAPACPDGGAFEHRGLAGRDLVEAALGGVPSSLEVSFDDPGIHLLTQPFIRAFKMRCDPLAARAMSQKLGVILAGDASFSQSFLRPSLSAAPAEPGTRDDSAVRLGEVAFSAIQGLDALAPVSPQSDAWLVVGRTVLPGWLIFFLGIATLVPGLLAVRSDVPRLAIRGAHGVAFAVVLFYEPEIALFAGALPNLVPPSWPKKYLALTLIPLIVLLAAGGFCLLRGQIIGSWLSVWMWGGLLGSIALLFVPGGGGKKQATRARRGKK